MGTIKDVETHSYMEWSSGIYTDNAGQEFEFVFTRTHDLNSQHESREVVNIEKDYRPVSYRHPVWKEVQKAVNEWKEENVKFTVEINREWIEALESLTGWVLNGSKASPEEALEIAIFSQIKEQRNRKV